MQLISAKHTADPGHIEMGNRHKSRLWSSGRMVLARSAASFSPGGIGCLCGNAQSRAWDHLDCRHHHRLSSRPAGPRRGSLGAIIGAFKSAASRRINDLRITPGLPV